MGPIWQAQLGESLVMLSGPSWAPKLIALLETKFGAHLQRQIRQSLGLALNAHSGNEWGKIPVLTGIVSVTGKQNEGMTRIDRQTVLHCYIIH